MKLVFKGIVQGVGFRPTVYRIAKNLGLKGYVLNKGSVVEVVIDKKTDEFIQKLKTNLPSIAKITDIEKKPCDKKFKDFKILYSKKGDKHSQIPYDTAICKNCLKEIFDRNNRRYKYPFTNCTVCGARFSLIEDIPYDRERTSMKEFELCSDCKKEYSNPMDRRYHAQTVSCPICGPKYFLYDKNKKNLGSKNAVTNFAKKINSGKIGIIKSWGGMHICCNLNQISRFREWYSRPQKSFAVMVKDIKTAEKYGNITDYEKEVLISNKRPIVLVEKKKCEEASPGLNKIGLYLPYTGIHHILFSYLKSDALLMTSANIPGEPMLTRNKDAFLLDADCYLLHNRKIPNRIDDSVIKIWKNNCFFIRKSRGYVPDPIDVSYKENILSVGPGENITAVLSHDKKLYSTQYIGNSKYYSVLEFLSSSIRHLMNLTFEKKSLDAVAMDMHPGYDSRIVAKHFSEEFSAPLFEVQHHHAHAASLMLEHNLDETIVLSLDGLGYGDDGNFWGGEVLYSTFEDYKRVGHLEYIPLLGGDKAAIDPRRLVFAIFNKFGKQMFFKDMEAEVLSKLMDNSPLSSSMGRVLDALSCYLDVCCRRTYDGETAMKLERYLASGKNNYTFESEVTNGVVKTVDLFRQLDEQVKKPFSKKEKADISFSFVKTIVDSLCDIAVENAEDKNVKNIGVSGGVSYNLPIVEMIEKKLKKHNFKLLVHNSIPNGDGGISTGQNAVVGHKIMK